MAGRRPSKYQGAVADIRSKGITHPMTAKQNRFLHAVVAMAGEDKRKTLREVLTAARVSSKEVMAWLNPQSAQYSRNFAEAWSGLTQEFVLTYRPLAIETLGRLAASGDMSAMRLFASVGADGRVQEATKRVELTGRDGGPIPISVSHLSAEERRALIRDAAASIDEDENEGAEEGECTVEEGAADGASEDA